MATNESIRRDNVESKEVLSGGTGKAMLGTNDAVTEDQIDRLEAITGGDDEDEELPQSEDLQQQFNSLDASTEEELDALEVDLAQDSELGASRDGSGRIIDELAEEEIAKSTEVGPGADDRGARSVEPGRQDTSGVLRRHHPAPPAGADPEAIVEGNVDAPLDEGLQ